MSARAVFSLMMFNHAAAVGQQSPRQCQVLSGFNAGPGHAAAWPARPPPQSPLCGLQVLHLRVWEKNAPQANVEADPRADPLNNGPLPV